MNAKYSEFVFYRQSFKLFSYKLYIKYLFKYGKIFPQALIHVVIVKIKQFYLFLVMQFKYKKNKQESFQLCQITAATYLLNSHTQYIIVIYYIIFTKCNLHFCNTDLPSSQFKCRENK